VVCLAWCCRVGRQPTSGKEGELGERQENNKSVVAGNVSDSSVSVATCLIPATGVVHAALVAQYTFDTDFNDSAGATAENGTSVDGASIQSGTVKIGSGALELDGHENQVEINVAGELDFDLETTWRSIVTASRSGLT